MKEMDGERNNEEMGKKCSFFGKFDVPCFLVTPVLRFTVFVLLLTNSFRHYKMARKKLELLLYYL